MKRYWYWCPNCILVKSGDIIEEKKTTWNDRMPFDRQLTTGFVQFWSWDSWGSKKCCQFCKRAFEVCMFVSAVLQNSIVVQVFTRKPPLVFIQYLLKRQTSVGLKQTLVFDSSMMTRRLSSTSTLAVHYLLVVWEQRNSLSPGCHKL